MHKINELQQSQRYEILEYLMQTILGDPGADSGGKGKSKRAEK